MTSNKEDYLKVIYEGGGLERPVPNKEIAQALGVAPASVSEMLTKLNQQGLIVYGSYKGSRLTEAGLASCMDVVRSHELWEVFLIRHLGYTWREAHEDAHLLEHVASSRMIDRLDNFLKHPQTCPHGSLIPQNGRIPESEGFNRLSDLSAGETAMICRVLEDGTLLDYLERRGLKIHETIQLLSIDDYEGPVSFILEGRTINISFKAATQIFVKRLSGPAKEDYDGS
ncbi:MAG: metal-dependent transcriptional regulator [Clostridiales bacterium]|nr:metal-dependent transcriptional regulator [Clostridiales bacterium]